VCRQAALGPGVFGWVLAGAVVRWVVIPVVQFSNKNAHVPCDLYTFPVVLWLRNDLLSSSVIVAVVSSQLVSWSGDLQVTLLGPSSADGGPARIIWKVLHVPTGCCSQYGAPAGS